ncbi:flagellar-associated protein, putative [Bodo saltans]|uniref:Flagellar-associated protein, putative n=1 Tax=Bodo saltans TaxID=75058 RepID=A0A0S4JMK5_BODSA|nr:flagellar-associated protein, putative [Bodo saltans]|eukprot:CUG92744.1 flagellar-associated protein, putative [Bodo saltans]
MERKQEEEFGISAAAIESLERNFVEVMKELSAEDNLERFKLEYEKLHRALKKSHESEKRLIKQCQELNQEIVNNAHKIQAALQLSQDDETTIASLRKEIEKAWKMVDGAHEKEARAKDTIQQLKKEVARLTTLVEQGAGLTLGHESNLQDLIEDKKELSRDRDASKAKVVQLTHDHKELVERLKRLTIDNDTSEMNLQIKTQQYQQLWKEFENEQKQKEISERKVQEYHQSIEKRMKELEGAKKTLLVRQQEQERLDKRAKEERELVSHANKNFEAAQRELDTQKEKLNEAERESQQLKSEIPKKQAELDKKIAEVSMVEATLVKLQKVLADQDEELIALRADREKLQGTSNGYGSQITQLLADIESSEGKIDGMERKVKEMARAKNLTVTMNVREEGERVRLEGTRVIEQGKNRSLAQELDSHLRQNEVHRREIFVLEQQQAQYYAEAQEATSRYQQALEQVRLGNERKAQLSLELEDAERKLKNQQSMYEQVRSDRALYKKSLNEAQSEINEMLRRFKLMDHQIKQLKDELGSKERLLCQAHATHKQLGKDIANAEQRVNNLKEDYSHAKGRGDALAEEIKQLSQIIADCDTEKAKQHMKFNAVTNERNILATQLIRRNDELSILYEKIRIQQSTLGKGETQYRDRLVDIRMLRDKVHELRLSLRVALSRIRNVEEMKKHVTLLQRQLMQERAKVKALYEELQNPMNVHHWRSLEGSDPQEMENLLKIHTLQKRLIAKTEECVAKDRRIQEREQEYSQLKNVLARQPGPEIAEQLNVYHENILRRGAQIQRMETELESTSFQEAEYTTEVERLQSELQDVKKKFFDIKTKNKLLKKEKQMYEHLQRHPLAAFHTTGTTTLANGNMPAAVHGATFAVHHPQNQPRFAGGGFSLSQ